MFISHNALHVCVCVEGGWGVGSSDVVTIWEKESFVTITKLCGWECHIKRFFGREREARAKKFEGFLLPFFKNWRIAWKNAILKISWIFQNLSRVFIGSFFTKGFQCARYGQALSLQSLQHLSFVRYQSGREGGLSTFEKFHKSLYLCCFANLSWHRWTVVRNCNLRRSTQARRELYSTTRTFPLSNCLVEISTNMSPSRQLIHQTIPTRETTKMNFVNSMSRKVCITCAF